MTLGLKKHYTHLLMYSVNCYHFIFRLGSLVLNLLLHLVPLIWPNLTDFPSHSLVSPHGHRGAGLWPVPVTMQQPHKAKL